MNQTNFFKYLLIVCALLIVSGCFDDREILFEHQELEWEPPNPANNELNLNVNLEANQTENETVTLRIRYAGEHQPEDFTGVFEIDTDAVEGEHYTVSGYSVTIPANSSFSEEIEIEIISETLQNGESFDMLLTITDESDFPPMENYKDFNLFIEKAGE